MSYVKIHHNHNKINLLFNKRRKHMLIRNIFIPMPNGEDVKIKVI